MQHKKTKREKLKIVRDIFKEIKTIARDIDNSNPLDVNLNLVLIIDLCKEGLKIK